MRISDWSSDVCSSDLCPELQELVDQLEQLPAPDGFRRITHMLVDAGARDITWVDPLPADIIRTPPAIGFTVATMKFQGRVTVLYERDRKSTRLNYSH